MRSSTLPLLVIALAGCATPDPPVASPPRGDAPPLARPGAQPEAPAAGEDEALPVEPVDAVLGWVAGEPVGVRELLVAWNESAPREVWLVLEKVVSAHLAAAEARRLGMRIEPEALARRVGEERARLDALLTERGTTLAAFARDERGVEPERFLATLEEATRRRMVVERVVRAWVLQSDWVRLRLILVESAAEMEAVRAGLAAGEAFAELARAHSVDATASAGGLVPFLVREEESPLARHAFALEEGETGHPFEHGGFRVLMRLEERHEPLGERPWSVLGLLVERSLREHPLTDTEFKHWKLTMERRYPIDVGPLRASLGIGD